MSGRPAAPILALLNKMGAAASTGAPYASEKEALDDGKTQAEIDAWKKAHPAATAAASADDASSDIEILYWGIPWRGNYMRLLLVLKVSVSMQCI